MEDPIETCTPRYALGVGRSCALIAVSTIREASVVYCRLRDESDLGASQLPEGVVYDLAGSDPKAVAVVSYDGRIWDIVAWKAEHLRPGA